MIQESAAVFFYVVSQGFRDLLNTADDIVKGRIILSAVFVIYVNAVIKGRFGIGKWNAEAVDLTWINAEVSKYAGIDSS